LKETEIGPTLYNLSASSTSLPCEILKLPYLTYPTPLEEL
jgi:hypothetical protein